MAADNAVMPQLIFLSGLILSATLCLRENKGNKNRDDEPTIFQFASTLSRLNYPLFISARRAS